MVAKRKAKEVPEARRANPYAELSREELDAALADVREQLGLATSEETMQALLRSERQVLDGYLWLMVREGKATWNGGKPTGSKNPIRITPGPPISDYIIEERDRLRN